MDNSIRKLHMWASIMTYVTGSFVALILLIALFIRRAPGIAFFAAGIGVVLVYFVIALTIPMNMEKPTFKERASYAVYQLGGKKTYILTASLVAGLFIFCGILFMSIQRGSATPSHTARSTTVAATTEATTEETTASATAAATATSRSSNDLNPELVAFLDAYESFVDEYCEFMRSYMNNPYDYTLIARYAEIIETLTEYTNAADNYNTSDMSAADLAYYLEVTARCTSKMLSVYY